MAKDKTKTTENVRLLGTVSKIHDSNNCETDKGFKVAGKFEMGAVLEQDVKTRKVKEREKATSNKNTAPKNTPTGDSGRDNNTDVNTNTELNSNNNVDVNTELNSNTNSNGEE